MNKPKKKKIIKLSKYKADDRRFPTGYNQACDEWEKWLPSEGDIRDIISYNIECSFEEMKELAKAISKRLRGEK